MISNLLGRGYQITVVDQLQHGFNNDLATAVAAQASSIYFYGAAAVI